MSREREKYQFLLSLTIEHQNAYNSSLITPTCALIAQLTMHKFVITFKKSPILTMTWPV